MKTTKKEFRAQIQEHVKNMMLDEVEIKDGYGIEVTPETLLEAQMKVVMDEFTSWYSNYERKLIPSVYTAFKSWLLGLPTCMSPEYTYYNISQTLRKWFEACGTEYVEGRSDKEAELYYHLVVREFEVMLRKTTGKTLTSYV